jgi:hypothetical protein
MSGWLFDDKKDKIEEDNTTGNVYETKMDYVGKVAGFLENWVKEMRKDIKKL